MTKKQIKEIEKDKQIKEMAKVFCTNKYAICENCLSMRICLSYRNAKAAYEHGYRKASKVAREIFEEIERLMLDGEIGGKYPAKVINPDKYAELKKKYLKDGE